jgi:2-polyprenyl-3-methyl-5-hydroxy-6-metoxy-1,4-benzoquinol methylase
MAKKEKWTGERLETFVFNESAVEHLHRYAIAIKYGTGKIILDIACGEGYGSNLLAQSAAKVTGVDIDPGTIKKAILKYPRPNLDFIVGSIENIPLASNSFDIITCFETLEHVHDHEKIMQELKRVLKPDGILIISTPDKKTYQDAGQYSNPYHKKELYANEFNALINRHFHSSFYLFQRLTLASYAFLKEESTFEYFYGNYDKIATANEIEPMYIISIASDMPIDKPTSSLFSANSILQTALNEKEASIKRTITYRIGHFILLPGKIIRNTFFKRPNE